MYKIAAAIVQHCQHCSLPTVDAFASCRWNDDPKAAEFMFKLQRLDGKLDPDMKRFLDCIPAMQLRSRYATGVLRIFNSEVDLTREELEQHLQVEWKLKQRREFTDERTDGLLGAGSGDADRHASLVEK